MSLKRSLVSLERLIDDLVEGRTGFLDFQRAFIDIYVRLPDEGLTEHHRRRWELLYSRVVTSVPDDEQKLREELAQWR